MPKIERNQERLRSDVTTLICGLKAVNEFFLQGELNITTVDELGYRHNRQMISHQNGMSKKTRAALYKLAKAFIDAATEDIMKFEPGALIDENKTASAN